MYKNPQTINFFCDGKELYLQTFGLVISDIKIPIISSDTSNLDISVTVDNTIKLLNANEDVVLEVYEDVMRIVQSHMTYDTTKSYESGMRTKAFDLNFDRTFNLESIKNYVAASKALDEIAKILAVNKVSVSVSNGRAFMKYSNTAFVKNLDLPDCTIASEVLRKVVSTLERSKTNKYYYDEENNVIYFQISLNEVVAVPITKKNNQQVELITEIINNTRSIGTINFALYAEHMETIYKNYKKLMVELSICDSGLRMFIDQSPTQIVIGTNSNAKCTIQVSTAQLQAICRVFGEYTDVEVRKGENKICLVHQNSNSALVLAGLVY